MNAFVGLMVATAALAAAQQTTPAANQIVEFQKAIGPFGEQLTTSSGMPVEQCQTYSLDKSIMTNDFLMDNLFNFARERIPERTVHAPGACGYGYFELEHDLSHITKADFLNGVGKKTPCACRFSLTGGQKGSPDSTMDTRGFSVKYYTREGNCDMAMFNTPVSSFKDPLDAHGTRASRYNPASNLPDLNMAWDRITLRPQFLHVLSYVFAGWGQPASYRHISGFSIHTFQFENSCGETAFGRFNYIPVEGIKNLDSDVAKNMTAQDPHYMATGMYNDIASGKPLEWHVNLQIFNMTDYKKLGVQIFDVQRTIDEKLYPYIRIGKLVLDRNPTNYFAECEQLAFCPCHMVPGMLGAPDKLYESRRFVYRDAQNYRLGVNHNNIPVNCPYMSVNPLNTYNRDGVPPVADNGGDAPNYFPNSFSGATAYDTHCSRLISIKEERPYNMDQVQELYKNILTQHEKDQIVKNVGAQLVKVTRRLQKKAVELFRTAHKETGDRIAEYLELNKKQ
ncbi:catalase-A-like [Bicyclus anynana]|uniref:Catalase-A-like n=1 Tax=Bicyclus anynana TaxID=110368 RepID=A0A6J1NXP7_BICAN|nr:catalase-A-like [Bicyclus anynana]